MLLRDADRFVFATGWTKKKERTGTKQAGVMRVRMCGRTDEWGAGPMRTKNNKRLPDGRKCKVWLRVGRQDNCKSETLGQNVERDVRM